MSSIVLYVLEIRTVVCPPFSLLVLVAFLFFCDFVFLFACNSIKMKINNLWGVWPVLFCVVFLSGTDCCWATRHCLSHRQEHSWLQSPDALCCREEISFHLAVILLVGFFSRVLACQTFSLETVYRHKVSLWVGRPLFSGPGMPDILTWNSLPSQSVSVGRPLFGQCRLNQFTVTTCVCGYVDLCSDSLDWNRLPSQCVFVGRKASVLWFWQNWLKTFLI